MEREGRGPISSFFEQVRTLVERGIPPLDRTQRIARELKRSKELSGTWRLNTSFSITGLPAVGKTTQLDLLSIMYDVPSASMYKIGELQRALAGSEKGENKPIERPPVYDTVVDGIQLEIISSADKMQPFILDSRLAGVWREVVRKRDNPQIANSMKAIFLELPEDIAAKRRAKQMKGLTPEEIVKESQDRTAFDIDQFSKTSIAQENPEIMDLIKDPFNPGLFDVIIDANDSEHGVFMKIHRYLRESGCVVKVNNQPQAENEIKKNGIVFEG
jgi:hypothetical protein